MLSPGHQPNGPAVVHAAGHVPGSIRSTVVSTPSSPLPASTAPIPATNARFRERLDLLTSIRFFAAMHVVLYHYAGPVVRSIPLLAQSAALGYYAVSIFYVLSGFVLVYSYSDAQGALRGSRRAFWVGRLARIYPAYALGFLLCIPGVVLFTIRHYSPVMGVAKASISAISYLLMVQAWIPSLAAWWNYPGWSVSVEGFFYLCFPFLLTRVSRYGTRNCYVLIAVAWLASVGIYGCSHFIPNLDASPTWRSAIGYNPLLRLPTFLTGMAVGRMLLLNRTDVSRSSRRSLFAIALCLTVMGLTVVLQQNTLRDIVIAPAFAYMVYSLAADRSYLAQLFSSRPLVLLGDASYAIYILQWPVYWLCGLSDQSITGPKLAGYILVLMLVSILCFLFIEEPLRHKIRLYLA
jgi:peptidoglycan/LPS O-acetylase OafA/YrhL